MGCFCGSVCACGFLCVFVCVCVSVCMCSPWEGYALRVLSSALQRSVIVGQFKGNQLRELTNHNVLLHGTNDVDCCDWSVLKPISY